VATTDISVPTAGSPVDLVTLTASASVPFLLSYFQANSGVNAAQIQKIASVLRSTAGSGAAGSLGIRNRSPAGPGASTSGSYLVSTPGSLSGTPQWCEDWQQFGGFELDKRDDPILVPSGLTWAAMMPSVAAGFSGNVNGEFTELK
jgi:hypothetical protein